MIERFGKQVLTEAEELVAPAHTALLIVDMQNDCCAPGGAFAQQGADMSLYTEMVPRLARLISAAREAGVLLVFIQATTLPDGLTQSPAQLLFEHRMKESYSQAGEEPFEFCIPGTWGHAIMDELAPGPNELVIQKHRSSAFIGTNLDLVLRSNGIKTIVVAGCTTEGCVDSTIRDGGFLDYYPIAVRDCIASDNRQLHDAAMLILEAYRAIVIPSNDISAAWAQAGDAGDPGTRARSSREAA